MKERGLDVVLGAIVVWVIVVIIGAGTTADSETWLGTRGVDTAMQVGLLLLVLAGAVFSLLLLIGGGAGGERQARRSNPFGVLIVGIAAVVLFSIWQPDFRRESESGSTTAELPDAPAGTEADVESTTAPEAAFELVNIVIVVAVLAAGVAGLVLWRLGQRFRDDDLAMSPEQARHAAVRAAHDRLLNVTDPRTAVIAAYAELEGALTARDLPRGDAETAAEYLARIVDGSPVDPEPFRLLGRTYDRARFSTNDISSVDRDLAQDALASALDEMGPAPVTVVPTSG